MHLDFVPQDQFKLFDDGSYANIKSEYKRRYSNNYGGSCGVIPEGRKEQVFKRH